MNRHCLLLLTCVALGCKREERSAETASARSWIAVDVDGGTVRVAAAGDISDTKLESQVATAELVEKGNYDAVLLLGDTQYPSGALADFQAFFDPTWGRLGERLRPAPGNHEYRTENAAGYFAYFGNRAGEAGKGWYSFDLGAWHLIALNSSNGCKAIACDEGSEQVRWLKEDLEAHRNRCTLAYWHHPRFSSGAVHGDFSGVGALWKTLAERGVDVVLNGHEHFYERFAPIDGVREFIVGTGGIGHYQLAPMARDGSQVRDNAAFGFLELTLKPGSYEWRFVAAAPSTYSDSGSAACR